MKNVYILPLFFIVFNIQAQVEDAWIFFKDKPNVQESLQNPITILTQKAIDRKNRHTIALDERDVPVDENYITQIKNVAGIRVLAKSKWFNCVFVRGAEETIRNLSILDFVSTVDFADNSLDQGGEKREYSASSYPNSKFELMANKNFDYGAATAQIEQIHADHLHTAGFTGEGITIAVMDSGFPNVDTNIAFAKARAEGRILDGYDFPRRSDDEFAYQGSSHGSLTFSDIAGVIEGEFVGTAPDASYHLFITEDIPTEGPMEEAFWVEAAERADSLGVDVINTSLGYSEPFDNPAYEYTVEDMDGQTAFISRGANIAFEKGMLVVVSAGNSGGNPWGIVTAPGDAPGAFSVGAINAKGNYVSFSSRGPTADNRTKPDVVARGSSAAIVRTDGSIGAADGTSFSSPIMAGAIACLWQAFPQKTNAEIMQMVRESASQFSAPDNRLGYGIPNFETIIETLGVRTESTPGFTVFPNPTQDRLFFEGENLKNTYISLALLDGKEVLVSNLIDQNYISLTNLSSGVYVLTLENKNVRYEKKIVKQ